MKSTRCTTVNQVGTTSLTLGTSSGIHAWTMIFILEELELVRMNLYGHLLRNHPDLVEDEYFRPHDTAVISVPQKAPEGATLRTESSPFQLLERVKFISENYVKKGHRSGMNTHNVSSNIS